LPLPFPATLLVSRSPCLSCSPLACRSNCLSLTLFMLHSLSPIPLVCHPHPLPIAQIACHSFSFSCHTPFLPCPLSAIHTPLLLLFQPFTPPFLIHCLSPFPLSAMHSAHLLAVSLLAFHSLSCQTLSFPFSLSAIITPCLSLRLLVIPFSWHSLCPQLLFFPYSSLSTMHTPCLSLHLPPCHPHCRE
jgi:hypothetical protein